MPEVQWKLAPRSPNPATVLDTGLNALANAAAATSATISNDQTTELDQYADFELAFTMNVAPTADRALSLYIVRSVDGTNFEDGTAARPPRNGWAGAFPSAASTAAQRVVVSGVLLPPGDFRVLLVNETGQSLSASGHTLKMLAYRQQVG